MSGLLLFARHRSDTHPVDLDPSATVGELRKAVAEGLKLKPSSIEICFQGTFLRDDRQPLADTELSAEAVVEIQDAQLIPFGSLSLEERERCGALLRDIHTRRWHALGQEDRCRDLQPFSFTVKDPEVQPYIAGRRGEAPVDRCTRSGCTAETEFSAVSWAVVSARYQYGLRVKGSGLDQFIRHFSERFPSILNHPVGEHTVLSIATQEAGDSHIANGLVEVLLDCGADPSVFQTVRPVHAAFMHGQQFGRCNLHRSAFQRLVEAAEDQVFAEVPPGTTLLHLAALNHQMSMCTVIVNTARKHGRLDEMVHQKDDCGRTPLLCALTPAARPYGDTSNWWLSAPSCLLRLQNLMTPATIRSVDNKGEGVLSYLLQGRDKYPSCTQFDELLRFLLARGVRETSVDLRELTKRTFWPGLPVTVPGRPAEDKRATVVGVASWDKRATTGPRGPKPRAKKVRYYQKVDPPPLQHREGDRWKVKFADGTTYRALTQEIVAPNTWDELAAAV